MDWKYQRANTALYAAKNLASHKPDAGEAWKAAGIREGGWRQLRVMAASAKDDCHAECVADNLSDLAEISPRRACEVLDVLLARSEIGEYIWFGLANSLIKFSIATQKHDHNVAGNLARAIYSYGDEGLRQTLAEQLGELAKYSAQGAVEVARSFSDMSNDQEVLYNLALQMSDLACQITDTDVGFIAVALAERADMQTIRAMVCELESGMGAQSEDVLAGYMDLEPVLAALEGRSIEFSEDDGTYDEIMDKMRDLAEGSGLGQDYGYGLTM